MSSPSSSAEMSINSRGRRLCAPRLPPHGGVEVRDLVDGQRVDAAREVLPAVVADDEHDVALVELAGDPDSDARDRAAGDAGEDPCLLYTSDAADEEDSVDLGGRR